MANNILTFKNYVPLLDEVYKNASLYSGKIKLQYLKEPKGR